MSDKTIFVKFTSTSRPPVEKVIRPGTLTRDVMRDLELSPAEFQLCDGRDVRVVYGLDDVIYALVTDGGLVYVTARVEAGRAKRAA